MNKKDEKNDDEKWETGTDTDTVSTFSIVCSFPKKKKKWNVACLRVLCTSNQWMLRNPMDDMACNDNTKVINFKRKYDFS